MAVIYEQFTFRHLPFIAFANGTSPVLDLIKDIKLFWRHAIVGFQSTFPRHVRPIRVRCVPCFRSGELFLTMIKIPPVGVGLLLIFCPGRHGGSEKGVRAGV